jgi:predicted enzyme related to lactoylglutathione lyase
MPGVTREGDIHSFGNRRGAWLAWFKDPEGNILNLVT